MRRGLSLGLRFVGALLRSVRRMSLGVAWLILCTLAWSCAMLLVIGVAVVLISAIFGLLDGSGALRLFESVRQGLEERLFAPLLDLSPLFLTLLAGVLLTRLLLEWL